MRRWHSRIELIVEHYAEDKEAAFAQQPLLGERAVEAVQDGVMSPHVEQGTHMLYGYPQFDDVDPSDASGR